MKEGTPQVSARDYFEKLSGLLLGVRVTDRRGSKVPLEEGVDRAVGLILKSPPVGEPAHRKDSRKVLLVGNGGSAAIVSHMQNDLCKMVGVRALVFTEQPLLTAISNDHGYPCAFGKLISLWVHPGDLLVAVSSSGRSENMLLAVEALRKVSGEVITFTGFVPDNPLRALGDLNFYVASDAYGFVETAHAALGHLLTDKASARRPGVRGFWTAA